MIACVRFAIIKGIKYINKYLYTCMYVKIYAYAIEIAFNQA